MPKPHYLAIALVSAIPAAHAQCRLCEKPINGPAEEGKDGQIDLQIEASLNFDRLVVMGTGEGSATGC